MSEEVGEPTKSRRTRATSTLEIARVLLDYVAGPSWYISRPDLFFGTCVIRQDDNDQGGLKHRFTLSSSFSHGIPRVRKQNINRYIDYRGVEARLLVLLALSEMLPNNAGLLYSSSAMLPSIPGPS